MCHLGHLFKSFQVLLWSLCATLLKRYVLGEVRQLLEPGSEPRPVGFQGAVSHSVPPHKLVALLAPPTSLLQQIRLGSQQAQGILKIGRLTLLSLFTSFPPIYTEGNNQKRHFQVVRQMASQEAEEPAGKSFTSRSLAGSAGHTVPLPQLLGLHP